MAGHHGPAGRRGPAARADDGPGPVPQRHADASSRSRLSRKPLCRQDPAGSPDRELPAPRQGQQPRQLDGPRDA
ncbi:MAG: hypothetical protein MZV64_43830 [Ignavibacteriales bacterium]|nr:hypothetical protein [Ignavibacteriales bacterium]